MRTKRDNELTNLNNLKENSLVNATFGLVPLNAVSHMDLCVSVGPSISLGLGDKPIHIKLAFAG